MNFFSQKLIYYSTRLRETPVPHLSFASGENPEIPHQERANQSGSDDETFFDEDEGTSNNSGDGELNSGQLMQMSTTENSTANSSTQFAPFFVEVEADNSESSEENQSNVDIKKSSGKYQFE